MLISALFCCVALTSHTQGVPTRAAATFPQRLYTVVCGQPALPATVQSAVDGAIHAQFRIAEGVHLAYDLPTCQPLFGGQKAVYTVKVLATSLTRVQAQGNVAVTVSNAGKQIGREELLWFCNKPENLKKEGPLFDGTLSAGNPVRLLYHHQNRGSQPLYMRIELVNSSDKAAHIWIIPGDGRPNRDPVWSGLKAARAFLPALLSGSAEEINLPPKTAQPIGFRRLVMGDTASGLATLKLDVGGPDTVEVRAEATVPIRLPDDWTQAMTDTCPWHWVKPHGLYSKVPADYEITPLVYLHPYVDEALEAEIGGRGAQTKFGLEGIPRQGGGRGLNGNYAVLHTYSISVRNPTKRPGHIDFIVDATTNYTAAVFAFPSQFMWLRPLQQHESKKFLSIALAPGERKTFKVRTMPVSGGWYPATFRLQPAFDG